MKMRANAVASEKGNLSGSPAGNLNKKESEEDPRS